jgi:hypothetical protein
LDDEAISDTIKVPQTADWDAYEEIEGDLKSLPAGEHVLKLLITGSWVDIDWIALGEEPKEPTAIGASPQSHLSGVQTYRVYDLRGVYMGTFTESDWSSLKPGAYIVRSMDGHVKMRSFL